MEIRKHVFSILVSILLLSNILLSSTLVINQVSLAENQAIIVENQEAIAGHVDSLSDYLAEVSGEMLTIDGQQGRFNIEIHMRAEHRDPDGIMIGWSEHAGVLTTIGKNYIEDQLGDSPNATGIAQYISLSNDAGAPAVGWLVIPNEIAANNLTRAQGAYTSTGDGVWTITYTFTASGAQSAQLAGLNWDQAGGVNQLLCADQMTAVSMENLDTLAITWTITVT